MKHKISVIIPVYNNAEGLKKTIISLENQSVKNFKVIVVDDSSTDNSVEVAKNFPVRTIVNENNRGPAFTRNRGIKLAKSDIVAFIDSDCTAKEDWIKNIYDEFKYNEVDSVMGNTKIPKSNFFGDSIACLGFPGGANAGFENIWHVSNKGMTNHITSCNFAAKKSTFLKHGFFDESFPLAGGEDPELSYQWSKKGVKIKYCPSIIVYHEPIKNFNKFVKWMFYRGRGNYYFKKKVKKIDYFIKLRVWSSKNIIFKFFFNPKIFSIIPLLFLMFFFQQIGYFFELYNSKR